MREFLSILGGIAVAVGMLAVIAVGIYWDTMEYEEREEERRRRKEKKDD